MIRASRSSAKVEPPPPAPGEPAPSPVHSPSRKRRRAHGSGGAPPAARELVENDTRDSVSSATTSVLGLMAGDLLAGTVLQPAPHAPLVLGVRGAEARLEEALLAPDDRRVQKTHHRDDQQQRAGRVEVQ